MLLRYKAKFALWVKTPNSELGAAPLDLLWSDDGARHVVETVDEVLTGQPD